MTVKVDKPHELKERLKERRLILYGMGTIGMEISQWLDQQEIEYIFADKNAHKKGIWFVNLSLHRN